MDPTLYSAQSPVPAAPGLHGAGYLTSYNLMFLFVLNLMFFFVLWIILE